MQLIEEFINREGVLGYQSRVCTRHKIEIVFPQSQDTTGFDADNRDALLGIRQEEFDIVARVTAGFVQHAF